VCSSDLKTQALRERAFAGLDDQEKIRVLTEWIFRKPPPHHHSMVSLASWLLKAPEPVIKDYSELRRLMAAETDSRRFFQLYLLSPPYDKESEHDFTVDRARGLFMEGVAADRGQSTSGHPLDSISSFCFSHITERLRDKSRIFKEEVYPDLVKLDFEQRNLALAKWLKENWPGCENLVIPSGLRNEMDSSGNMLKHSRAQARERTRRDLPSGSSKIGGTNNLLTVLAIFVSLTLTWFCLRRLMAAK
jgi:hypothetical protein